MTFIIDKPIEGLDRMATARLVSFFSDITCGEACWKAREDICKCSCGGKNHGIQLRGENAVRTSKQNGYRYELVSVGKYSDLQDQVEQMIRDDDVSAGEMKIINGEYYCKSNYEKDRWYRSSYIHPSRYNTGGRNNRYVLKLASLPQCIKWQELEYMEVADDRDRYHKQPAILWKLAD
jgi:hypothetical protein